MAGHGRYGRPTQVPLGRDSLEDNRRSCYDSHPTGGRRGTQPGRRTTANGTYHTPAPGPRGRYGAQQRDRSRSPVRTNRQNGYRHRAPLPPPRPVLAQRIPFSDPYQEVDKEQGRITDQGAAFQGIEYVHRTKQGYSPKEAIIKAFLHDMGIDNIEPRDVPGKAIRDMAMDDIRKVAHNLRVIVAHIASKEYEKKFAAQKFRKPVDAALYDQLVPGAVVSINIAEPLINRKVEVNDPDRTAHANGALIGKIRTVVVFQVVGEDMQACETTAFGDSGYPPLNKIHEYMVLKHEANNSNPSPPIPHGVRTVRYKGNDHLTKTSYFRYTRPQWISIKNARFAVEGDLLLNELTDVADAARLGRYHALREQAERRRRIAGLNFRA